VVCCMSPLLVRNWYNAGTSHHTVRRDLNQSRYVDCISLIPFVSWSDIYRKLSVGASVGWDSRFHEVGGAMVEAGRSL
jgi:hypothetical protein